MRVIFFNDSYYGVSAPSFYGTLFLKELFELFSDFY